MIMKVLLILLSAMLSSFAEKKHNVVVLYADDWRFDTLGVAGNPILKTPHLDALAKDGFRFTQSYVTSSVCGVSRASLFTGQWMSRHKNVGFKSFKTPWSESYPGLLRENGYHVGHVGKWHNGDFPAEHFDYGKAYARHHWIEDEEGNKVHVTQKNENDALEFLRSRPKGKPFVLTVAFFATHAVDREEQQFFPQPESMKLYTDVSIPVPVTANDKAFRKLPSFIANEQNEGRNRWFWRFDTPEKYQLMMKNYYRLATEVDAVCGRVIAELKDQGVYDETLIIFTGDNGYFHGEHGLADKWYPHQESIRVPLIVRDPRMAEQMRGKTNGDFTLNVDLAPTILGVADIVAPTTIQGRDLEPLYSGRSVSDWRTEFFYEHPTLKNKDFIPSSEALVRKDWKYFYWPEYDHEQLFHIAKDPYEENDVINDDANSLVLKEMRQRFNELKRVAE